MPKDDSSPTCFNCSHACDEDDYCHGCMKYVCSNCDVSCGEYSRVHEPADHLVSPEDRDAS